MIYRRATTIGITCAMLVCTGCQTTSQLSSAEQSETIPSIRSCDWKPAMPLDVTRAEIARTTVPEDVLVALAPESQSPIQLASFRDESPATVSEVNGQRITNCEQLLAATNVALANGKDSRVVIQRDDQRISSCSISPGQLADLTTSISEQSGMMRSRDSEGTWITVCEDSVRCRFLVRIDRLHGLLHVKMSLGAYRGEGKLLPLDVDGTCNAVPLRCLTAEETLDLLYVDAAPEQLDANATSFAAVSDSEGYLVPANYESLQARVSKSADYEKRQPALLQQSERDYPGPAVLGDARGLATMLLQRQLYAAGTPERTGWIMFYSPELRQADAVTLSINLGSGPRPVTFRL